MRIAVIVEGKTEVAFKDALMKFLKPHLAGRMPRLDFAPYHGRIPKGEKLRRVVDNLLDCGAGSAGAVIALTDVYTGTSDFTNASDAKAKMSEWVGNNPRFHPHAAQHDFEAWLIPYWPKIQTLAQHNRACPSGNPEDVNMMNPPSRRIAEVFRVGACPQHYVKPRDAARILRDEDLTIAANACRELKAFLNTVLSLCGADPLS